MIAAGRLQRWRSAWQARRQERLRCAFLPDALAVEQSAPNPLGRLFSLMIMGLFVVALGWGWFGQIDIVAVARGKLVPVVGVASIQSELMGRIMTPPVKEGALVKAGDLLVTLDDTMIRADIESLGEQISVVLERLERQRARRGLVDHMGTIPLGQLLLDAEPPRTTSTPLLERQWQQLLAVRFGNRARVNALEAQRHDVEAEQKKLTRILPMQRERRDALHALYLQKLAPRLQYLDAEQRYIEVESSLDSLQARWARVQADIQRTLTEDQQLLATQAAEALSLEESLALELQKLGQLMVKVQRELASTLITSPIDGVVRHVIPLTQGTVIPAAQLLMEVVPATGDLQAEVWVQNRDVGFVSVGQSTQVKVDSFNYTRYGDIPGQIDLVSADASDESGKGPVYKALVSLSSNTLAVDGVEQRLLAGMDVSVEIKTGTRRILDFFISPLLRYGSESIRER
ncbi:HlyD family type I secretion periplasmic adaptor subunit [Aestuariirhabdus litorea]|uniref:Membrane fusion protein (MFP) family protein n=1 Tax=Aestuariirhabdus litorea TaxID=2528527 RepID=A0A3P3VP78_9GAMM|nr:HlyD family type I secretion periplasmic adaptor subunit [Aestuariirhabdus litorea]RRJ84505.1 HlyD family type I secretion periplasmic adaptor subunit [Aestuariirhabdus litorea]RWW97730.1 HlyD family type I secretion periplasmic adaptor subunit [Endozoicomonadaceae bacterium GTF-13]